MSDPVTSTSSEKKKHQERLRLPVTDFFFNLEGKVYFGEVRGKSEEVWGGAGPGG